jgi:coenzyme F420-reducing hydrogenase delta subunit
VVSAAAIIRAFSSGVDGVLITACGRGDCHYSNGNESCEKVVEETRDLMRLAGVVPQRLRLDLSSDVDGGRFVALLDEFAGELAGLNERGGPKRRAPSKAKRAAGKKSAKAKAKAAAGNKPTRAKRAAATKTAAGKRPARKKSAAAGKKPATRVTKKVAGKKSAAPAKRKR